MNQKHQIKQMREFICKYGTITTECKRPADEYYRKGSYYAHFNSEKLGLSCCVGHVDKYHVYKDIINEIKRLSKNNERNEERKEDG